MRRNSSKRSPKKSKKTPSSPASQPDERVECMIEIISCRDLLPADRNGYSDPYVKVSLGDKELHRTKHLRKTLNPEFDHAKKSKFVLECSEKDLYEKGGLEVDVKDWDRGINSNDRLGTVLLPYKDLYNADNKAREYRLTIKKKDIPKFAKTDSRGSAGFIKIRCQKLETVAKDISSTKLTIDEGQVEVALSFEDEEPKEVGGTAPSPNERIECMIEIISCRDLLPADRSGYSDPYVKVSLGDDELHRTKYQRKTLNPKFNDATKSKFLLECNAKDLYEKGGLEVDVKDWDRGINSNDRLGTALLPYKDLYNADNRAHEYRFLIKKKDVPKFAKTDAIGSAGFVKIRCWKKKDSSEKSGEGRGLAPTTNEKVKCLVEILSCRNLLPADRNGYSDPFVKVLLGDQRLHRTKHVRKTLNPMFNDATNSNFVLECNAKDLYEKGGLEVIVKDWDRGINSNDRLGTALLPYEDLYNADNTAQEYRLTVRKKDIPRFAKTDASGNAGFVKIRCRNLNDSTPAGTEKKKVSEGASLSPPLLPASSAKTGQGGEQKQGNQVDNVVSSTPETSVLEKGANIASPSPSTVEEKTAVSIDEEKDIKQSGNGAVKSSSPLPAEPIHDEEELSLEGEDIPLPMVKDQAKGAAWAGGLSGLLVAGPVIKGGISGLIFGGPIMAALLGLGGYAVAKNNAGASGSFCRKTGDFTNRLGGVYSEEWRKSRKEHSGFGAFCHGWSTFSNRFVDSIEASWEKSGEKLNDKKSSNKDKTTNDGKEEEKKKRISFFSRSKNFIGNIGMSIKKTWNESDSIPLYYDSVPLKEQENSTDGGGKEKQ